MKRWMNFQIDGINKTTINNTAITDKGLVEIAIAGTLQSLNLVGTKITVQGVMQLKN